MKVNIAYVTDQSAGGVGAYVDDTRVVVDGTVTEAEGFETGLGAWSIQGHPREAPKFGSGSSAPSHCSQLRSDTGHRALRIWCRATGYSRRASEGARQGDELSAPVGCCPHLTVVDLTATLGPATVLWPGDAPMSAEVTDTIAPTFCRHQPDASVELQVLDALPRRALEHHARAGWLLPVHPHHRFGRWSRSALGGHRTHPIDHRPAAHDAIQHHGFEQAPR